MGYRDLDGLMVALRRTNALFETQLSAQFAEFANSSISFHFQLLLKYTSFLQIIPRMMRKNQNLKKQSQNSRGKKIKKKQKLKAQVALASFSPFKFSIFS